MAETYTIKSGDGRVIREIVDLHLTYDTDLDEEDEADMAGIPPEIFELEVASVAIALGADVECAAKVAKHVVDKRASFGAKVEFEVIDILREVEEEMSLMVCDHMET